MQIRTILKTFAPLAVAALTLAGCGGSLMDDLNDAVPQGSPFTQELFKNYAYLARSFGDVGSAASGFDSEGSLSLSGADSSVSELADAYAQKAIDASKGVEVLPEQPPDDNALTIRRRLMAALDQGRDKFPADAARAQVDYDCMIMNARVPALVKAAAECGRSLQRTLAQLEHDFNPAPPPPPPVAQAAPAGDYTVYFEFDSWTLSGEDLTVLQNAVNTARAGGQSRIAIVGHTDTSGSPGYNQNLSVRRANVVKEALVDMGARRESIQTSGVGESDLAVQTGDGVKEPKNRRAVVTLQP
ncbi:MAG TPA: OmpA family protein [Rhizomicrobium sp.]|jgi:outer membrane protein OmpA-like peptidoglycan-associated protein